MNGSSAERGELSRRLFLGTAAAVPILTSAGSSTRATEVAGEVPYRTLGRTGERVSAIGVGGFHIGKPELTEPERIRIIRTALDSGINFLDHCWDYNGGQSEVRMGKALRDGYRQRAFLMTKIDGRNKRAGSRWAITSFSRARR